MSKEKKKLPKKIYVIVAVVLMSLLVIFQFNDAKTQGDIQQIELTLSSTKEEISSGEKITFTVSYKNTTDVTFDDARLVFVLPQGFVLDTTPDSFVRQSQTWKIGKIKGKAKDRIEIAGWMFGDVQSTQNIQATLYAKSESAGVYASKKEAKNIHIIDSLLSFHVSLPEHFALASLVDMQIEYEYPEQFPFTLLFEFEKPQQLSFVDMNVEQTQTQFLLDQQVLQREPVKGHVFVDAKKDLSETITFSLYVVESGRAFLQKQQDISFHAYDTGARFSSTINEQKQNIALNTGKQNSFAFYIQNVGTQTFYNLSLQMSLPSGLIDETHMDMQTAIYDKGSLEMNAHTDPRLQQLSPGDSLVMLFSLPINENIIPEQIFTNLRDEIPFHVNMTYTRDGQKIITQTPEMILKINSDLHYLVSQEEGDDTTMHIDVGNTLNWVSDATLVIQNMPIESRIISSSKGKAEIHENQLIWELGQISPGKQLHRLTIELPPSDEHVLDIALTGMDMHTEQPISVGN